MGVDAKLFVGVSSSEANSVYGKVKQALDKWQRNCLDKHIKNQGYKSRIRFLVSTDYKDWTNGVDRCSTYDFESFVMSFRVNGEQRKLFCTHTCSGDYSDTYQGSKIIFSLGCWGMSDEIMTVVAEACKEFGDVYYDFNDCDEHGFEKLF